MNKSIVNTLIIVLFLTGCHSTPKQTPDEYQTETVPISEPINTSEEDKTENQISEINPILEAENKATPQGKSILETGRIMIENDEIIRGGCWDYINEVYKRAGYPKNKQEVVFKSSKSKGPYADIKLIQPGDWLYYVNHSYGKIEHSAIFVYWEDFDNAEGMMLSYGGESRQDPARYISYDLSNVYMIVRAKLK